MAVWSEVSFSWRATTLQSVLGYALPCVPRRKRNKLEKDRSLSRVTYIWYLLSVPLPSDYISPKFSYILVQDRMFEVSTAQLVTQLENPELLNFADWLWTWNIFFPNTLASLWIESQYQRPETGWCQSHGGWACWLYDLYDPWNDLLCLKIRSAISFFVDSSGMCARDQVFDLNVCRWYHYISLHIIWRIIKSNKPIFANLDWFLHIYIYIETR